MTIDDAGIKKALQNSAESGCETCPYVDCFARADGKCDMAKYALEYIEALEACIEELSRLDDLRRNRQHTSNWIKYWREKHGESTLAWPDWDEIFADWEEAHALAQSRLRRMKLFKRRQEGWIHKCADLRVKLKQAEWERDAAITDMYHASSDGGSFCDICKYTNNGCDERKAAEIECWAWRGMPQEVKA